MSAPHPERPRVPVIVPVDNDRDALRSASKRAQQTFPVAKFEVLEP
jgi:hypothetical protein